ncbi:uncharacterized protein LAESUDRAFT_754951 [Laetiporus sulphureus 93-53]|uniref:Uncharacterized protein n=1 Tax=Laetiporus sulphureus 93-53 TaxID=1314785 RepID=A0A165H5U5_9APHY|nr:uncharacterized protein LAESUDRAFT_754951 [Laetiporus sulphureus 93-53]KZT11284.1 hypothetical protein LAESUDRAFT_754951 [Laetiporus sulphureus 93-53]
MWDQLKAVHMSRGLATDITRWRALLNAVRGLEAIGEEVPKKLRAIIAVVGLHEELNMVETKLDAVDRKLWTMEQVAALALNEEARVGWGKTMSEMALAVAGGKKKRKARACFLCRSTDHLALGCSARTKSYNAGVASDEGFAW